MEAREFLNMKNWVVVGDVLNSSKYAHKIMNALKNKGFNVSGVNPRDDSGEVFKSLSEVNYKIEVVDLCINPKIGIEIIKEANKLGIKNVLIQPGAGSEEIINYCINYEINEIQGCALIELSSYNPLK